MFVTNRLEFVAGCDRVLMIDAGAVVADGAFADLMKSNTLFRELMHDAGSVEDTPTITTTGSGADGATETGDAATGDGGAAASKPGSSSNTPASPLPGAAGGLNADPKDVKTQHGLIQKEKREKGSVGVGLLAEYARASGGISVVGTILVTFLAIEAARLGASLWISKWANSEGGRHGNHTDFGADGGAEDFGPTGPSEWLFGGGGGDGGGSRQVGGGAVNAGPQKSSLYYIGIYGAISGGQALLTLGNLLFVAFASVAAGRTLHGNMMHALLRAPMAFFHATPLGRIINRISKDVSNIDRNLASNSTIFLRGLVQIIGTLVIIGISTPYTLVTFVPLIAMFFWTYKYLTTLSHLPTDNSVIETLSTTELTDTTSFVGRRRNPSAQPLGAVTCCTLLVLTCTVLMTSSHSKVLSNVEQGA